MNITESFNENEYSDLVPLPILKAAKIIYGSQPAPNYTTLLRLITEGVNGIKLPAVNFGVGLKRAQWRISLRAYRDWEQKVQASAYSSVATTATSATPTSNRKRGDESRARIKAIGRR